MTDKPEDTHPPGFPPGRVPIIGEVHGDGEVRPRRGNGPPPELKIVPDDQAQHARQDTLNMEEAFAKIAPRPPSPEPCPTGFGKPRRRR